MGCTGTFIIGLVVGAGAMLAVNAFGLMKGMKQGKIEFGQGTPNAEFLNKLAKANYARYLAAYHARSSNRYFNPDRLLLE